jgi:hypothetical protein
MGDGFEYRRILRCGILENTKMLNMRLDFLQHEEMPDSQKEGGDTHGKKDLNEGVAGVGARFKL